MFVVLLIVMIVWLFLQRIIEYFGKDAPVLRENVKLVKVDSSSDISKAAHIYTTVKKFIVFDAETTGFSPEKGDKMIEVAFGKYSIVDGKLTPGELLHTLMNT